MTSLMHLCRWGLLLLLLVGSVGCSSDDGANETPEPTLILIFGGTNDRYAGAPCGVPLYAGWSAADLKQFCPAFCYMLDYLKGEHPNAKIVNVMNDCFSAEWVARIEAMTAHYGVQNIALNNIKGSANLQGGHPTKATMKRIKEQIVAALTK